MVGKAIGVGTLVGQSGEQGDQKRNLLVCVST